MKVELENVKPMDIEKRSFEIITEELGDKKLVPGTELIVKRCIHTSADFDYAENLCFSENAVEKAIAAIKDGKCIDTTMGLTPLEGLVMGTRCGDIDPAIMEFLAHKLDLDVDGVMKILNKDSGVYGLSGGLSSDFRDLTDASLAGDKKAQIAMEVFSYRVAKYIGAYVAVMNGVDDIVFTAGIGENDDIVREQVCSYLGYLGIEFNTELNKGLRGKETELSMPGSKVKVFVIPTNEELAIARETLELVRK